MDGSCSPSLSLGPSCSLSLALLFPASITSLCRQGTIESPIIYFGILGRFSRSPSLSYPSFPPSSGSLSLAAYYLLPPNATIHPRARRVVLATRPLRNSRTCSSQYRTTQALLRTVSLYTPPTDGVNPSPTSRHPPFFIPPPTLAPYSLRALPLPSPYPSRSLPPSLLYHQPAVKGSSGHHYLFRRSLSLCPHPLSPFHSLPFPPLRSLPHLRPRLRALLHPARSRSRPPALAHAHPLSLTPTCSRSRPPALAHVHPLSLTPTRSRPLPSSLMPLALPPLRPPTPSHSRPHSCSSLLRGARAPK